MNLPDVTALTTKQLNKEYNRLNGNCKTNYDVKLFLEIKYELSFRYHFNFK
jgi:hypothetical protein